MNAFDWMTSRLGSLAEEERISKLRVHVLLNTVRPPG